VNAVTSDFRFETCVKEEILNTVNVNELYQSTADSECVISGVDGKEAEFMGNKQIHPLTYIQTYI